MSLVRFCFLLFLVAGISILANASAPEEAPAADAHGAAPAGEIKAGPPPWTEVQSRMLVYKGQRQQLIGEMEKARAEQRHMKMGTAAMKAKGAALIKMHKEYKELTEEYNKLLVILRYRFPERLSKDVLLYHKTEEVPDLEEMEAQMDLDARLNKSINRARDQFGAQDAPVEKDRTPSSVSQPVPLHERTIREDDPIRLRK